jgi:transcriptional antiterminator RfaH
VGGRLLFSFQRESNNAEIIMLNWYVKHSKPNKEELLNEQLRLRRIETYYPFIKVRPVNPHALKIKPYFPGYLFIRTNLE